MLCDLIIDGNYLLSRMVFTLHKNNLLFGGLNKSLETAVNNYKKWYTFSNIYLVSDSKEKSWRKKINTNYKTNRKKDTDIDWEFVYSTYDEFKQSLNSKGVKVLEAPHVEGDDWISFLVEKSNYSGRSTLIVSNDHDIKQLITYSTDPHYINIMSNEMQSRQRMFVPKNYQIFVDSVSKENDDIFSLNDNKDFIKLLQSFLRRCEVLEVSGIESLLIKLISGDTSDNINSCWSQVKNGKKRGIAEKGAQSIFNEYLVNFGEPNISDPDLSENIADLICEKKKLPKSTIAQIKTRIEENMKLIHLDTKMIPKEILTKMSRIYSNYEN
jgi:5'-3' exonuclease